MKIPRAKPFWLLLQWEAFKAWREEQSKKNAAHNETVLTRQVLRALLVKQATKRINEVAGGEPRHRRRAMAISAGHRDYRKRHGLPELTYDRAKNKRAAQRRGK